MTSVKQIYFACVNSNVRTVCAPPPQSTLQAAAELVESQEALRTERERVGLLSQEVNLFTARDRRKDDLLVVLVRCMC